MIGEDISPTTRISREELRELQWRRLQPQIAYNYAKSPFYRERFDAIGLQPADIRAWDDFQRVPTMDKHDHRQAQEESIRRFGHPFGMLCCVPTESFTMLSATSGTSGTPTFYTLTEPDLKIYSELMARKLRLIGLRPGDRVLHGFALSMMVGGQAVLQLLLHEAPMNQSFRARYDFGCWGPVCHPQYSGSAECSFLAQSL